MIIYTHNKLTETKSTRTENDILLSWMVAIYIYRKGIEILCNDVY